MGMENVANDSRLSGNSLINKELLNPKNNFRNSGNCQKYLKGYGLTSFYYLKLYLIYVSQQNETLTQKGWMIHPLHNNYVLTCFWFKGLLSYWLCQYMFCIWTRMFQYISCLKHFASKTNPPVRHEKNWDNLCSA